MLAPSMFITFIFSTLSTNLLSVIVSVLEAFEEAVIVEVKDEASDNSLFGTNISSFSNRIRVSYVLMPTKFLNSR